VKISCLYHFSIKSYKHYSFRLFYTTNRYILIVRKFHGFIFIIYLHYLFQSEKTAAAVDEVKTGIDFGIYFFSGSY